MTTDQTRAPQGHAVSVGPALWPLVLDELAALGATDTPEGRSALALARRLDDELPPRGSGSSVVPVAGHQLTEHLLTAHRNAHDRGLHTDTGPLAAYQRQSLAVLTQRRTRAVYERTGSRIGGRGVQLVNLDEDQDPGA